MLVGTNCLFNKRITKSLLLLFFRKITMYLTYYLWFSLKREYIYNCQAFRSVLIKDIFTFYRISNEYKCQCRDYDDMTITSYLKEIIGAKMIACYILQTKEDKESKVFISRTDNCLLKVA